MYLFLNAIFQFSRIISWVVLYVWILIWGRRTREACRVVGKETDLIFLYFRQRRGCPDEAASEQVKQIHPNPLQGSAHFLQDLKWSPPSAALTPPSVLLQAACLSLCSLPPPHRCVWFISSPSFPVKVEKGHSALLTCNKLSQLIQRRPWLCPTGLHDKWLACWTTSRLLDSVFASEGKHKIPLNLKISRQWSECFYKTINSRSHEPWKLW